MIYLFLIEIKVQFVFHYSLLVNRDTFMSCYIHSACFMALYVYGALIKGPESQRTKTMVHLLAKPLSPLVTQKASRIFQTL